MGAEWWVAVGVILTALVSFVHNRGQRPKILAEAKLAAAEAMKTRVETEDLIVGRLYRHIERVEAELENLRIDFDEYRRAAEADKARLYRENKILIKRVAGLEAVLKVHPIPKEMQDALDRLDREGPPQ